MNPVLTYQFDLDKEEFVFLKKRNAILSRLLKDTGLIIRIVGNAANPAIIINNNICLSASILGWDIILKTCPKEGSEWARIGISSDKTDDDVERIRRLIEDSLRKNEHKRTLRIYVVVEGMKLFLSNYHYTRAKEDILTRWDESLNNSCVFFTDDNCDTVLNAINLHKHINSKKE